MNKIRILSFLILIIILTGCSRKAISGKEYSDKIDTSGDPEQSMIPVKQNFSIDSKHGSFKISPLYNYNIKAKVVSRRSYGSGWQGYFAPVDLALVWGLLSKEKFEKGIRYSQKRRWYYYNYDYGFPISKDYIINHSANNHLIPSSFNIRLALEQIKEGDLVLIDGILVNMRGVIRGKEVYWNSSVNRNDSGDGSCELIYVKSIRINNKLYR